MTNVCTVVYKIKIKDKLLCDVYIPGYCVLYCNDLLIIGQSRLLKMQGCVFNCTVELYNLIQLTCLLWVRICTIVLL